MALHEVILKRCERVCIGDDVVIEVVAIESKRTKIAITAKKNIPIWRAELDKAKRNDSDR